VDGLKRGTWLVGMAIGLFAAVVPTQPVQGSDEPMTTRVPRAAERARDSVVIVEREGRPVGLGFVLAKDGRILTALSPLGEDGAGLGVRLADGTRTAAQIDHVDASWDLALLATEARPRAKGLAASEAGLPAGAPLSAFALASARLRAIPVLVRGRTSFAGRRARTSDALELAASLGPNDFGTPIVDERGAVVALATRGCLLVEGDLDDECVPVAVGAPVAVLRRFLSAAPPPEPPMPWLGARVVAHATPYARGLRIQAVQPESPAAKARLRGGSTEKADLVVAVDGRPVATPEALAEEIRSRKVGDSLKLLVLGQQKFREVQVVLEAAPELVED